MRPLGKNPAIRSPSTPGNAPAPERVAPFERRPHQPTPGAEPRTGFYIPLKLRVALTVVAGLLWVCFSLWLGRAWITTLGHDITIPLAILVVTGIAVIPGYLNIQLLSSILLDRPPNLRLDVEYPPVALLIAAYNEEDSITDTLDFALRSDYLGPFEIIAVGGHPHSVDYTHVEMDEGDWSAAARAGLAAASGDLCQSCHQEQFCADCHGKNGAGREPAAPPLAKNRAVLSSAVNPIRMVLFGGYAPGTSGNPRPFGMPPYSLTLSDEEIAEILIYVRSSWGNHARPIRGEEVAANRGNPLW